MRTCACLFCAAAVGMATAAIGGGSYDYTQSLLPTDNRPLQLEGMRGGGGTVPTPDQMGVFKELLRDALAKEIPLDNIDIVYMPEGDMLRFKVYVTDEISGEEGTVKTESVTRSGADAPATTVATVSDVAGAVANPTSALNPTRIGDEPARPRAEGGSNTNLEIPNELASPRPAGDPFKTIADGFIATVDKLTETKNENEKSALLMKANGILRNLQSDTYKRTFKMFTENFPGEPHYKIDAVEYDLANKLTAAILTLAKMPRSGGTRRRTRRTRHRTDRKNRPLRKSNHD